MKSFLMEYTDPCILHIHYYGFWCPGDARSQGISSYDIDQVILEAAQEGLITFDYKFLTSSASYVSKYISLNKLSINYCHTSV